MDKNKYKHNSELLSFSYACGSFGELLQGALPNGKDFLVTLPIQKYSKACFLPKFKDGFCVEPEEKVKSLKLAELLLSHYQLPIEGLLLIESDIPIGKGLSSSSADLVATARAIASAYDICIPNGLIEKYMASIEPSDGVMFDTPVSYYYIEGTVRNYFNPLSSLCIVALDEGGQVNTIDFNKVRHRYSEEERQVYASLLQKLEYAFESDNLKLIGEIATKSAQLHQKIKPNEYFQQFVAITHEVEAVGVVVAHSGTCLGILLDQKEPLFLSKKSHVLKALHCMSGHVFTCDTISYDSEFNKQAYEGDFLEQHYYVV